MLCLNYNYNIFQYKAIKGMKMKVSFPIVAFVANDNFKDLYQCSLLITSISCKDYYTLLDISEGLIDENNEWEIDYFDIFKKALSEEKNNIRVIKTYIDETNEIIALAIIKIYKENKYLEITDIITDDKYRRKGIGNTIIKFIEGFAKENNISKIGLASSINSTKAHEFFQKCGYEKVAYEYLKRI